MFIRELFRQKRFTLSFEFFPPKREGNLDGLFATIQELSALKPDFISVTYGAGGSTRERSLEIASRAKKEFQTEVLAHLTCVQSTKDDIARILEAFRAENIENILALRGDPPAGTEKFIKPEGGFSYASDLVAFIKGMDFFSIGVAGSPEGHIEAPSLVEDIKNLKRKVDAGADFIITQLFFDNHFFYRFRDRTLAQGITIPILPGIFPILNYKQVERIAGLCGASIPQSLANKINKVRDKNEEVEKYGIEYATKQMEDLIRNDVAGIHMYSMNRSEPVQCILKELHLPRSPR
ncbi:MAG: methylenetetrahydrofolate reductase [NAD(P)H] [Syntrophales bacterium]|nr:methylenetetrahydrofolate reductase [NAD(P)H] [Syntrophales bacterium]